VLIDTQHEDLVHDVQCDWYGQKMATCSSDRTIKICSLNGGSYEVSATLQGHSGPVWQVSWAHPQFGVVLASCGFDGSVLIHGEVRPREWTILHAAHQLHSSSVNGVCFAPPEFGLQCAAASSDGRVSVLRHEPETQVWSVEYLEDCPMGVNAVSWAPAGAYYDASSSANQETPRLVTAGCDNGLRFWQCNTSTGEWTQQNVPQCDTATTSAIQHHHHKDWVRDVAWAPSLVPNHNRIASCSEDGQVLIWTQAKDDPTSSSSSSSAWTATLVHQFDEPVWRVSWSATGHVLAVSSGDATVTLWKEGLVDGTWIRMDEDQAAAAAAVDATSSGETKEDGTTMLPLSPPGPPPTAAVSEPMPTTTTATTVTGDVSSTAPAPPPPKLAAPPPPPVM